MKVKYLRVFVVRTIVNITRFYYRFKLFVLSVCMWCVTAYPNFKDALPNGNHVPHPCKVNYMWHGVGHHNPLGGGITNKFGMDFKEAGKVCIIKKGYL